MVKDQNAYDRLLIGLVLENGDIQGSYYPEYISEYTIVEHVKGDPYGRTGWRGNPSKGCGWDAQYAEVEESASWREDGDSFTEGSMVTGMLATGLRCTCGKITGVRVRWQADTSEAIHAVMRRLAELGALDLSGLDQRMAGRNPEHQHRGEAVTVLDG